MYFQISRAFLMKANILMDVVISFSLIKEEACYNTNFALFPWNSSVIKEKTCYNTSFHFFLEFFCKLNLAWENLRFQLGRFMQFSATIMNKQSLNVTLGIHGINNFSIQIHYIVDAEMFKENVVEIHDSARFVYSGESHRTKFWGFKIDSRLFFNSFKE